MEFATLQFILFFLTMHSDNWSIFKMYLFVTVKNRISTSSAKKKCFKMLFVLRNRICFSTSRTRKTKETPDGSIFFATMNETVFIHVLEQIWCFSRYSFFFYSHSVYFLKRNKTKSRAFYTSNKKWFNYWNEMQKYSAPESFYLANNLSNISSFQYIQIAYLKLRIFKTFLFYDIVIYIHIDINVFL